MVVGPEDKTADVVFVVEGTANLGGYIDVLREQYIQPTLEVFNGGPPDPTDYGHDYSCTLYNLVTFYSADILPDSAARSSNLTTNIHEFLTWMDNIPFIGGGGETYSHIAEGLSTALHVFDDIEQRRNKLGMPVQQHCILVCNSQPFQLPSQEGTRYVGYTAEQLANKMAQRNINLSIISPRRLSTLQRLFEESSTPDIPMAPVKDYTIDPRHLVLLHGYQLEERSHSPLVEQAPDTGNAAAAAGLPMSPGVRVHSPVPGIPTFGDINQPHFKIPSTAPTSVNMQQVSPGMYSSQQSPHSAQNPPAPQQHPGQHQQMGPQHGVQSQMGNQQMINQQQQPQMQMQHPGQPHPGSLPPEMQQPMQHQQLSHQPQVQQHPKILNQQNTLQGLISSTAPASIPSTVSSSQVSIPRSIRPQVDINTLRGGVPGQRMQNMVNMPQGMVPQTQQHDHMGLATQNMPGGQMNPNMPGQMGQNIAMPTPSSQQMTMLQEGPVSTTGTTMAGGVQITTQQPGQPGMPTVPGQPAQGGGPTRDRKIIWTGRLEWQEKMKSSGPATPKVSRSLQCQLSIGQNDPEINASNWPTELIMQLIPQSYLNSTQLQPLFKNSRQVAFHFTNHNLEALKNLYKVMGTGFAGCVHFPSGSQCEVRVLLLLFSNRRKAFIGLIPNDQTAFVNGIRNVIYSHKVKQTKMLQQQQQQQQGQFSPASMPQVLSQQMQQPVANTMANPVMTTQGNMGMLPNQQQTMQQAKLQQEQAKKAMEAASQQQMIDEMYFGGPNMYNARQQQLQQQQQQQQQRLQLQQQQQQQQQQVTSQQLQHLLLNQQQQGQQIRQPGMMMQQQHPRGAGPIPQGQQGVMSGGPQQVMQGGLPQMSQPGPASGPGTQSLFDDINLDSFLG